MPAVIDCPSCARKLNLPEDLLGKRVQCPSCGLTFEAALAPEAPALPADPVREPALPAPRRMPAPARLAPGRIGDEPCPYCGRPVPDDAMRCGYCGEYLEDEAGRWPDGGAVRRDCEPERGGIILTLGLISLACSPLALACCFFFGIGALFGIAGLATGIPAWVMGQKDLRKMSEYIMDPAGRPMTNAGMICGMIGAILCSIGMLIQLGVFAMWLRF